MKQKHGYMGYNSEDRGGEPVNAEGTGRYHYSRSIDRSNWVHVIISRRTHIKNNMISHI